MINRGRLTLTIASIVMLMFAVIEVRLSHSAGITKIRSTVRLDETGTAWSGPAKGDVFGADGKLVRSYDSTHRGTRMSVEPMK